MNKIGKKGLVFGLCASMGLSGTILAYAQNENKNVSAKQEVIENKENTKDETVYVITDATGNASKIIVSDWLQNTSGSDELNDISFLEKIENVKSDESYILQEDEMIWKANGNDIYYQGTTQQTLPVDLKISYQLDGKEIEVSDLVGKSGHVTICFEYEDQIYEMVEINGKEEKIYVPFIAIAGMILNNEHFRNIEVTQGKVINDGDHSFVLAVALTGVEESLKLNKTKVRNLNTIELSADVTDFVFNTTLSYVSNDVFNQLESGKLDSLNDLDSILTQLKDGISQLVDGSNALADGLATLQGKSNELVSGVNELTSGGKELNDGIVSLDNGIGQLKGGVSDLSSGLSALSSNSASLNAGAKTTFLSLLSIATEQIKEAGITIEDLTIENYEATLNQIIASLDEQQVYAQALQQVKQAVEQKRSLIETEVKASVETQVRTQVEAAVHQSIEETVLAQMKNQIRENVVSTVLNMSLEEYQQAIENELIDESVQASIEDEVNKNINLEQAEALVNQKMQEEDTLNLIEENVNTKWNSEEIQSLINQNVEYQIQLAIDQTMNSDEIQAQLSAASAGAQAMISLKSSLDNYNTFYLGILAYTSGVDLAYQGTLTILENMDAMTTGSSKLKKGASELYAGLATLQGKLPDLIDGINQLKDGSEQLKEGIGEMSVRLMEELEDLDEADLEKLMERLSKLYEVSNHYQNFSGLSKTMNGRVKFIYRTDKIQ